MRAYRLSRSTYPSYDGEGARRAGGRWNSKGKRVLYMSENRALCVLEVLVHLTDTLPDKYALGQADIPTDLSYERVEEAVLPPNWKTLSVSEQTMTRQIGDEWLMRKSSAVLWVPSVLVGEQNILCNPEHPDFERIHFSDPIPFLFDIRLSSVVTRVDPASN
jgi:RES domain-containing protein